jgi:CBS domain-containing protein
VAYWLLWILQAINSLGRQIVIFPGFLGNGANMKNYDAGEMMTSRLVSIRWEDSMENAQQLMDKHRIRHLPVRDARGGIAGIISDRDVMRAMNPQSPGFTPNAKVSEYMSWPVVTVDKSTPVKQLAEGMVDEKISAFLVAEKNEVVGIVTAEDLLRLLATILADESGKNKLSSLPYNPVVQELLRDVGSVGI